MFYHHTVLLGMPGFYDPIPDLIHWMRLPFLQLHFHSCLLASINALVSGTQSPLGLSQAKPLTQVDCHDYSLTEWFVFSSSPPLVLGNSLVQSTVTFSFTSTMGAVFSVSSHFLLECLLEYLQSLYLTPDLKNTAFYHFCH